MNRNSSPLWYERMNYDIYVRMISCGPLSVLWCPAMCNTLCLTKPGPGGMYTSPPGGSMYAYMGRVWRSTTHPTLPGIKKRPRPCKVYEKLGPAHMLHVFAFLTSIVGWLTEQYSSHVLPTFFQVKARCQCTVDNGVEDTMEVGDEIFLGVYFY